MARKRMFSRVNETTGAAERWAEAMHYPRELGKEVAVEAAQRYAVEKGLSEREAREASLTFRKAAAHQIRRFNDKNGTTFPAEG